MKIIPQSHIKIPAKSLRRNALLTAMLAGSGTIYQLCERADIDIGTVTQEHAVRHLFELMIQSGLARIDGIVYSISRHARAALAPVAPAALGQAATSHYRGPACAMPVTHTIRHAPQKTTTQGIAA